MKFTKKLAVLLYSVSLMLVLILAPSHAHAKDLVLGAGGRVTIELITSEASFSNTLSLVGPDLAVLWARGCNLEPAMGLTGQRLMSEKTSQHGCRAELDANLHTDEIEPFAAGDILKFNLCAQADADAACEWIWSSDPNENSDGFDHVVITELRSSDWPGRIYQLAWEDLPKDQSDQDFDDLIAVVRVGMDSDGDGLWDDWETYGIDDDADGIPDLDLPKMGADPQRKDIFVEIDYMACAAGGDCTSSDTHSHIPKTAAVDEVRQAFAKKGITLHVDVGGAVPHHDVLGALSDPNNKFDLIKANPAYFGPNNPRRFSHHYGLFVHRKQSASDTETGQAELGGNDFFVSFGGWNSSATDTDWDNDGLPDKDVGTLAQQAGILMHELGHNLNLQHGGGDCINYKPNYLSVMNYEFDMEGIPPTSRLDYSDQKLPTLDEAHLNEPQGIQDGTDETRFDCPDSFIQGKGKGTGPINWDCGDDLGVDTDVAVNLSKYACDDIDNGCQKPCDPSAPKLSKLHGYDDWANLKFDFHNSDDFEDGQHMNVDIVEMDLVAYRRITPPSVTVTLPVADAAIQDGVVLTAEASGLREISSVDFFVRMPGGVTDGIPGAPIGHDQLSGSPIGMTNSWGHAFDTTQLDDGFYVALAVAEDAEGSTGWSQVVPFSIRNWAVVELLPASVSNKAGRTMPVKFSLRIAANVDPAQPFVYNEELEVRIYEASNPTKILQRSSFGARSTDYRIDGTKYITNFKTSKKPGFYVVEIWRPNIDFLVGSFTFSTVK